MIKLEKLIIIEVAIFCSSCNKKNEVVKPKIEQNAKDQKLLVLDYHKNHFKRLRNEMDRIE